MNDKLKAKAILNKATLKELAEQMGINQRVFYNKLNRRMVNGYEAHFTNDEKLFLAKTLGMKEKDIK